MFMLMLYRYITGYVYFKCFGTFPERFLNLLAKDGLTIWNSKLKNGVLSGYMRVVDYRKIIPIARKAKVKTKIQRKHGAVFIVHRYRHRLGIPVGTAIFFLILTFLSSFIWNIEIVGNTKIKPSEILKSLEKVGVYEGVWTKKLHAGTLKQDLLIANTDLSWAAINIKGSFCSVEVREVVEKNIPNLNSEPCNIVAKRGGIVLGIIAKNGNPVALLNEAVAKGDILVTGALELKNGITKFVTSNASVIAKTERKLQTFIPFNQITMVCDQEGKTKTVISIFNQNIPLFFGQETGNFITQKKEWQWQISGVRLPLKTKSVTFFQTTEKKFKIDKNTAKKMALKEMEKLQKVKLKNIKITEFKDSYKVTGNGVILIRDLTCQEDIAKSEKIIISE